MPKPNQESDQKFFSVRQLAVRFSLSERTVWRLVERGELAPPTTLGEKCVRWTRESVESFEAGLAAREAG